MGKISEHFTEDELRITYQDTRVKANYQHLVETCLEKIREHFGEPVCITSGFRSPLHNANAGGKPNSFHLSDGGKAAADFFVNAVSVVIVFEWLRLESELPFDKVILEYKNGIPVIIHIQTDRTSIPRRQALIGGTGDSHDYVPVKVV